jgi:hypothetical protein
MRAILIRRLATALPTLPAVWSVAEVDEPPRHLSRV